MRDTEGYLLYLNANSFHTLGASNMKVLHGSKRPGPPYMPYMVAFYMNVLQFFAYLKCTFLNIYKIFLNRINLFVCMQVASRTRKSGLSIFRVLVWCVLSGAT